MRVRALWLVAVILGISSAGAADTVRLGYFPNLTHAVAMVGLEQGFFAKAVGADTSIDAKVFNAGPAEMEALLAGEIDVGYIGPGPAITGFVRSKGKALRVVAGAALGGASFIVRGDVPIQTAKDLAGKKLASPQIGNTQDVALRTYLRGAGLETAERGGAVTVLPIANADVATLFAKKELDGAWVPEPWASLLRLQSGGRELVDERSLWPKGEFPTTVVVVSTRFLKEHEALVTRWLKGQTEAIAWLQAHPEDAKSVVNGAIRKLTSRDISKPVLDESWTRLTFTAEIPQGAIAKLAKDAADLGYLPSSDVSGLVETSHGKAR